MAHTITVHNQIATAGKEERTSAGGSIETGPAALIGVCGTNKGQIVWTVGLNGDVSTAV